MLEAVRLARQAVGSRQGGPFGAVVVRGNEVVGRGQNRVTSRNDPTAHAEVEAIRDACTHLQTFRLDDCVLFTSCEPCPMCLAAIYWARIPRVYYACNRDDAAEAGFDDAHFYEELNRPIDEREVEFVALLREEGLVAMREWSELEDRVDY
jgi:tRNA(Arg) A34 adenosine deaminase TadA